MDKVALVFPGQGAQYPGMGRAMHDAFDASRRVFDQATLGLGRDVRQLCWDLDAPTLAETANAQPAILAASVACLAPLLAAGVEPAALAGLSLGEYSALVAAGSAELGPAMQLVHIRARLMQQAVPKGVGTMAAVIGLAREQVLAACSAGAEHGVVEAANFNAPDQIVISGHVGAVKAASTAAKQAGARRVVPLAVSAPFHCSLLRSVEAEFEGALAAVPFAAPRLPVVANATADLVRSPAEVRRGLLDQIASPVLWEDSVRFIDDQLGVNIFVEVGPGKTLNRFIKRTKPDALTLNVENPASLAATLAELRQRGILGEAS